AGCGLRADPQMTGQPLRSQLRLPERFTAPLPIPRQMEPLRRDSTTDYFEIEQRAASVELIPGVRTRILGYDGTFPGPTIRTRSGRRAVVTHHNRLGVPTVVHLHGGHTPAASDGYPTDLVRPGTSRDYDYPMRQRADVLWYHDHTMDATSSQVYRGLFGLHLVTDDEDEALPLPRGVRDLPLLITDRAFAEDGSFRYPARAGGHGHHGHGVADSHVEGVLGDVMLVNGAPWPAYEVDAARYRLRVLNACSARRLELALDPAGPLVQIGSDGGLLAAPVTHQQVGLAPAERFDLVVDFSAYPVGTEVTLRNRRGSGSTDAIMRFVVARRARDDSRIPARLSTVEPLDTTGARVRHWRLTRGDIGGRAGWVVNGKPFDPDEVHGTVPLGTTEIWRFYSDLHHPVHVHLDPFQVIGRGGHEPGPYDAGWKDTVDVRPAEHVDVAIRFTDYAGRFLVHCHNLEHEDSMMMAAFQTR
ncbi:MAG: multicopper oxidase family protein, partial [Micromonosporaceae bacterium]